MKSIWNALTQRLGQEDAMLVRIVHSQGSAPRHAGAQMAVFAHSQPEGTVGGGKVEAICLEHARTLLAQQRSNRQEYNLSGSGSNAIGMACGGQVTVDFLYLPAGEQSLQQVEQLAQQAPGGRVLVFGAGHVSRALAALLPALELDYLVVDDRPEFAQEQAFPGALAVHQPAQEGKLPVSPGTGGIKQGVRALCPPIESGGIAKDRFPGVLRHLGEQLLSEQNMGGKIWHGVSTSNIWPAGPKAAGGADLPLSSIVANPVAFWKGFV